MKTENKDIVIVGSGPGGVSTALSLKNIAPELAENCVVLEARQHPREKVCAGCITGRALGLFESLGINVTVPHVPIYSARFRTAWGDFQTGEARYGAVVRRDEFDADISKHLTRDGMELRQGVRVQELRRSGRRILVRTNKGTISAKVVVGADGAASVVRRNIDLNGDTTLLIQAELPIDKDHPAHAQKRIEFDFRSVPEGRRGYRWTFPYIQNGRPSVNVGICEWKHGGPAELKKTLIRYMHSEELDPAHAKFRFFPERAFRPRGPFAAPGILLVGEAAGIDPFLGEGLSYSVEYGMLAAKSIAKAARTNDFSFKKHHNLIKRSKMGRTLAILRLISKYFYGPLHKRLVKNGLMDPRISRDIGGFLAGNIKPTPIFVIKIALRLATNILL